MKYYNLAGLKDLWEDFSLAYKETEVYLKTAKICQVIEKNETSRPNIYKLTIRELDVETFDVIEKTEFVNEKLANHLWEMACYYEIDNIKYIPNYEVKNRCLYDYFGIETDNNITNLTDIDYARLLATKFKKVKKIVFISRKPMSKNFCSLVGIKSISGINQINIMDIIESLSHKYKDSLIFRSKYAERINTPQTFVVTCKNESWKDLNDIPLGVRFYDNLSARKSIKIDIIAALGTREYIIDSIELNHRTLQSANDIADDINDLILKYSSKILNVNITANEITEQCLVYIPKKAQNEFKAMIYSPKLKPIESAYDVLNTNIFNLKTKKHKTKDYDGGKRKYKLALGAILRG